MSTIARNRSAIIAWQLLFMLLGTTWLWAPYLNHILFDRTALISQYEATFQPYSAFFRIGDVLAGSLLLAMTVLFLRQPAKKIAGWLLLAISIGLVLDPLLTTTCYVKGRACQEFFSFGYVLHALETVVTAAAFFVIALYDSWLRKRVVSIVFVIFQIGYGGLFISQLANRDHFNTVSQYVYQTVLIVWLAWYVRDCLVQDGFKVGNRERGIAKTAAAIWAFLNGLLAIVISLAHIHLLGKIKGLYFAGDSAWLAQHGVIIGVVMLYLSRHLARGELRARQIFLVISGIEVLKYSVISPDPALMILYLFTFCALFVLRDDFNRGTIPITWQIRLKDLYFMVGALLSATLVALLLLDRDNKVSVVSSHAFDNFFDYVARTVPASHSELGSALLAHTISAFLAVSIGAIAWILFRPYKQLKDSVCDYDLIKKILKKYSASSEDYFKLWPADKQYFLPAESSGFIAYKLVGPVVFALADPVSSSKKKLLDDFVADTRGKRLKTCFLPVYDNSRDLYEDAGLEVLQIGSSAVINIKDFLSGTANDKWWRWQKNRAAKQGYQYDQSHAPHSTAMLRELREVSEAWLAIDGRKERSFSLGYFDESYMQQCTVHLLKDTDGHVIAFTNQLPHFKPSPTITVDLLRYKPDYNQAMPYLLLNTIDSISKDPASQFFDLGFVPFAQADGPLLRVAKIVSGDRFSYSGLEQFKNKFKPEWQANYLAYDGDLGDLALIALNLEKAMEPDKK